VAALEVDQADVSGLVGEEHVTGAGAAHQRDALTGQPLLDELADAAGAQPVELDVALLGHHRTLAHHHLAVERNLELLAVLQLHTGCCVCVSAFCWENRSLRMEILSTLRRYPSIAGR
jgi:hypothetical protein